MNKKIINKISVIILTHNEEIHIARAIRNIKKISNQIFVVDSFSNDKTISIAKKNGAKIYKNKFINHSKQFKWALKNLPIKSKWVMRLDADEYLEDNLIKEIKLKMPTISNDITGINIKRKHIFMGKWIKYGGRYPLTLLRLWQNNFADIEDRWMDEHMFLTKGRSITLKYNFADHNLKNLNFLIDKHNKYATREVVDILIKKFKLGKKKNILNTKNSTFEVSYKRFLKEAIYNKIFFGFKSLLYFVYRYFFLLGFLDGKKGLIYHFIQGFYYRFLVESKLLEIEDSIKKISKRKKIISKIFEKTGFNIN
ncbi:glycosyltransferase family 2 protein [Candidatus Pelagibacter ubique]|nr:glycosyltransferase family 2 protein [Candidatus Pelagibacter ubique]